MRLCDAFLFCFGCAALRLGNESANGKGIYSVKIEVVGPPFSAEMTIGVLDKNCIYKGVMEDNTPFVLPSQFGGDKINVGLPSNEYGDCSYSAGQEKITCFLQKWKVVFTSEEEVEQMLTVGLLLTKKGQGNESPFEIKIDNVTKWTESDPIGQDATWWRMTDVGGAGVVVTLLFPSTKKEWTYTVARGYDKEIREIEGLTTEFETMMSKKYTSDWSKVKTNDAGWIVHLNVEGHGPQFEIFLDHEKKSTVNFAELGGFMKFFDARFGQVVRFVFQNTPPHEPDYYYTVGDEKQSFQNLKGYNIAVDTIAKTQ